MKISTINRFFNIAFGALAMVAVALLSAYLAMRIAIHGREVEVPALSGLTLPEAAKKATALGLRLNIESRFYSPAVAPGLILSQSPASGSVVRREWTVRVAESLGPQQVSIPSLVGQAERPATIAIRRLGLELGAIAHLPSPGPSGIVLAQTPNPSTSGVDSPRVSLLLSAPLPEPSSTPRTALNPAEEPGPSVVMPSLAGLTLSQAVARTSAAGLHIVSVEDLATPPLTPITPTAPTSTPTSTPAPSSSPSPSPTASSPTTPPSPGLVVSQSPLAGHQIQQGDPVKITLGHN
ncbi:PASTA domain-containing protein [Granulicella sp. dw_53]|uniref:PASTA domain-containing protein n=1 Tax=Granulicella sp. dw_53 TaxID=2719792 RepID=UPI001BD651BD|nr:PASTA domain-containing protein [Granulicella sp. dw_53]